MKQKSRVLFFTLMLLCGFHVGSLATEDDPLLPTNLKGVKEVFAARTVALGWASFSPSPDASSKFTRDTVVGLLYVPGKKIVLKSSLETVLVKETPLEGQHEVMGLAPQGYFIAFAPDHTVWLITVERIHDRVSITRLRSAADDPEFSKLYWVDLEEPRFQSASSFLTGLLKDKERDGKK